MCSLISLGFVLVLVLLCFYYYFLTSKLIAVIKSFFIHNKYEALLVNSCF